MKNSYNTYLTIVLIGLFAFGIGCNKTIEPNLSEFGFDYYPIEIGQYRVYYTKHIDFNLDGSIDTVIYLTKETVEDTITYSDGTRRFLLSRYSADLESDVWNKDSLWSALVGTSTISVSEANIDYIKLSFPVKEGLQWDGNALNNRTKELYELDEIGVTYAYDSLNYASTLTVIQSDLIDPAKLTEDDYRIEVYAKDVGLIHKLKLKINYCDPTKCSENGTIEDGAIFEQKLIEFGKE